MNTETIVLGGGCCWCLDALYKKVEGVLSITSGYTGGATKNPTYSEVCNGTTGHAEVVKLEYDPNIVSLEVLLRIFFEIHDPTTLNQQGGDVGTQYRSAIFYESEAQKLLAEKINAEAQANWKNPIVTEIVPLGDFYTAENYHQDYYAKNPDQPYCVAVISRKLEKFLKKF